MANDLFMFSSNLEVCLLKDLGKISYGLPVSRYQTDKEGSPVHIINVSNLNSLKIEEKSEPPIKLNISLPTIKRYELEIDDVVISVRGRSLKASVVTAISQGSIAGSNVAFFRPNKNKINPLFVAVLIRSQWAEKILTPESSGTIPSIRITQLRDLKIPTVDLFTQNNIAEIFWSHECLTKKEKEILETRQKLIDSALEDILIQKNGESL
jgi:restriction endonuclease S subunit